MPVSEQPMITFAAHQVRAGQAGAAEDFEQMLGLLVRAASGDGNLVFANPGDWGIDVLVGDLRGRVTVWQAKYFVRGVGRSQQSQITASFESALSAAREHGYTLERWVLCIPASMDGPTMQWWQGWKAGRERDSGVSIDLWDETGLRELLLRPEAGNVRRHYYNPYRADASQAVAFPYRGLSAFGEQDTALFFGRDAAAAQVLGLMSARLGGDGLAVVSGVSGAGKSSLLRAGVLPRLRESGLAGAPAAASWPCRIFAPGRRPLDELAVQIAPLARADAAEVRERLAADPDGFALTARQAALAAPDQLAAAPAEPGHRRVLLVVDQCEQLYTSCDVAAERDAFITALCAAAAGPDPAALVVLVVRADFEARLADYQQLITAVQGRYLLTAMTELQLQLAITRPAAAAGSRVDDDLVQVLLDEVRARSGGPSPDGETAVAARAGVLPLLSHALDQAWRTRSGHAVTLADYERTGGIEGAVAVSAQRAYERLTQAQREAARQVFTRLTATSSDGTDTAARVARSDLSAGKDAAGIRDVEAVLEEFAAARLLVLDADAVEISHEALLSAWPLLRDDWLAGARADRIVRTRLHATAQEWMQDSRDPSYLYTGSRLDAAAGAAARIEADARHTPLGDAEKAFLHASRHADRRRARLRQGFTAVLVVLLVGLAAVTVTAVKASQNAASQRDLAISDQLIRDSQAFRSTNATIARQDSLAAWAIEPSSQAWSGMLTAAADPQIATITNGAGPLGEVMFSPDGKVLAVRGGNGAAVLWNLATLTRLGAVPHANAMTFSPDSTLLAATDSNGTVRLWNVATRTEVGTLVTAIPGVEAGAAPAVFNPDGRTVAVSLGGAVELWSVPTRHKIWTAGNRRGPYPYTPVAFLPGGRMLLSYGHVPWVLDTATHKLTRIPTTFPFQSRGLPFSPNGTILLGTDLDGTFRLWDAATGHDLGALPVNADNINAYAFSPDGTELATTDNSDGTVRLWDVVTRKQTGATISTGANGVSALAFSPDGQTLATSDGDGTVRLWDVATNPQVIHPRDATAAIAEAKMTRDGKILTTADANGAVHVWDTAAGEQISAIPAVDTGFSTNAAGGEAGIGEAALSPDGKTLALGHDGTVELWAVAADRKAGTLIGSRTLTHWLDSLAFSPDSTTLAVGDNYGHITLWSAATDRQTGTLTVPPCDIRSLAFSTDGKALADSENSGRVRLWDVATRQQIGSYTGGSDLYSSVALSPDGKTIAAVGGSNTVVLWNVATHKQTRVPINAGPSDAGLLEFSPDSKTLAVLVDDGTVRIWDLVASHQTGAVLSGSGGISALAFTPDGRTLITGDGDGDTQLWNTSLLAGPVQVLCSQIGGTLTPAEWASDVPSGPAYRDVCR